MKTDLFPSHWSLSTLGQVADPGDRPIISGPFGSNIGRRFFVDEGIPVIRGSNLTTDTTRLIDSGFVFVTGQKADELRSDAVANDLIFTAAGTLGQVGIIPIDAEHPRYVISNKQLRARVDRTKIDPLFAFYWFSSKQMVQYIAQRNTGSTIPLINLSVLRSLPIPVPPVFEQKRIAHILGTLDDKIELNRQMNHTLDELARTIFRSWFVDFDPVRAKAEGREPEGMDAEAAALFPDRFVDSALCPIPEGWAVQPIGELVTLARQSVNPRKFPDEMFDHYSLPAFDRGRRPISESGSGIASNKTLIPNNAVLISKLNPHIPRVWLPSLREGVRSIASTEFLTLAPNHGITREFVYCTISSETFQREFESRVTGTTGSHQRVSPDAFRSIPVVRAGLEIAEAFQRIVAPLLALVQANIAECQMLAELRDTLLPELLSGHAIELRDRGD